MTAPVFAASELAQRFGLDLRGADRDVAGVGTLADATPRQLGFLANPRYRAQLADTRAGVVVLREDDASAFAGTSLVARDPYAAFARISALFERLPVRDPGIHPSAAIDPSAEVSPHAHIGAFTSIGARTKIGVGAVVGPGCSIGDDCEIGEGCELQARVTLVARVRLGKRVRILPGAVLGAAGFGLAMDGGRWINVPQLGGVIVGDDCEIGANTTIDRGALGDTVLEEDVRLDNQIQIGHNCHIGAHTAMAGCVGVAGSTRIGRHCLVAGAAGISGHLVICDKVTISAMTMVTRSITEPGEYSSGLPMQDNRTWKRNIARFRHLDEIVRKLLPRVRELDNDE